MVRRRFVCGLLIVLYLSLIETVSFSTFDVAWTPSYFDDDDDFLPQVTKRVLLVTVDILPLVPVPLPPFSRSDDRGARPDREALKTKRGSTRSRRSFALEARGAARPRHRAQTADWNTYDK